MSEFDIDAFLTQAVKEGISDVHLKTGQAPACRKHGFILKVKGEPISKNDFFNILDKIVPDNLRNKVVESYELDFSYEIEGVSRFRVNLAREFGNFFAVIRAIPFEIPSLEKLHLPEYLNTFSNLNNGIVIVTGPTGSGKSSTLAAMIQNINLKYKKHILTIEDPVEFMFHPERAIITQRVVGTDTDSFESGIKYSLRQDPDVIMIGEIRDRNTVEAALHAAETGHLVFSTMHTVDAVQTVNRIVGFFEPKDREFIKNQVADTLKGTVSQRLLPNSDGQGRSPACEIMTVTSTVKDFILKDSIDDVYKLMMQDDIEGMISFNKSIYNLYKKGLITEETAVEYSDFKSDMTRMIKGVFSGSAGLGDDLR